MSERIIRQLGLFPGCETDYRVGPSGELLKIKPRPGRKQPKRREAPAAFQSPRILAR